jgi:signal transduction histidine kinase
MSEKKISFEDATLARAEQILADPAAADVDLTAEYATLAERYRSLLRKLNKTLVITDGYQSQLQGLNASLTQQVDEQTERRVCHERMLLQHTKLASMGEMIGAIAHQWRQPLSTVSAIIQNIRDARRLGVLDPGYLEKASGDALMQVQLMTDTIEAFRGFFHPSKGAETFSITAKIKEAASLIEAQLIASDITLVLSEPDADDTITSFPNEFTQVMLNLIANSRDAILTRRESGASRGPDAISVSTKLQGRRIVVEVTDNGCGISSEVGGRLFEPYFTTKKEGEGTGIGLYMSRLIIEESMGGKISFSSDPERTAFRIDLPGEDNE